MNIPINDIIAAAILFFFVGIITYFFFRLYWKTDHSTMQNYLAARSYVLGTAFILISQLYILASIHFRSGSEGEIISSPFINLGILLVIFFLISWSSYTTLQDTISGKVMKSMVSLGALILCIYLITLGNYYVFTPPGETRIEKITEIELGSLVFMTALLGSVFYFMQIIYLLFLRRVKNLNKNITVLLSLKEIKRGFIGWLIIIVSFFIATIFEVYAVAASAVRWKESFPPSSSEKLMAFLLMGSMFAMFIFSIGVKVIRGKGTGYFEGLYAALLGILISILFSLGIQFSSIEPAIKERHIISGIILASLFLLLYILVLVKIILIPKKENEAEAGENEQMQQMKK